MLECNSLSVWYPLRNGIFNRVHGYVRAVNNVSLILNEGETVGLVGESGCGKSTLGRALVGLETPTEGNIRCDGHSLAELSRHSDCARSLRRNLQMVFQDPFSSLDPRRCALDLLCEGLDANNAYPPTETRTDCALRLLKEVGLSEECLYRFPHEFSGGQRQRLSIARALAMEPKYVICDEPVSALDVSVQSQIIRLLLNLQQQHHLAYLFISHDLNVVRLISKRIAVMYLGHIVECGPTDELLFAPHHPYTQALFSAVPIPGETTVKKRIILNGDLPSPTSPPTGCAFHTRCPYATEICRKSPPETTKAGEHSVACHRFPL